MIEAPFPRDLGAPDLLVLKIYFLDSFVLQVPINNGHPVYVGTQQNILLYSWPGLPKNFSVSPGIRAMGYMVYEMV